MLRGDAYDYWLLDLDGTLVDVEEGYIHDVFDAIGDRLGYDFSQEQAQILWHGLGGFRNDQLARWNIDPDAFWEAFHAVEDGQRRAEHTFLYSDAEHFADYDGPLGLITHSQPSLANPTLDHLDIRDWFDTVVCCSDDIGWKPDPAPVERVLSDLDVEKSDAGVLAGDGATDIGAAWNTGLDGIHVERHGHDRRGMCVRGDYRVSDFDELFGASTRS
ncbi:HAD hydrolase-like protein [Halosegnis rubeus]|jgi:phosphoglycolate phosphatase|uniref:HAD hydrolase-like protein n=1 Tax=Halosegnis rubeus TaxID=2212850 RepID=A0A5N5U8Q8_9EURY|nr:HAD family hydrolase [Halosegnis rubeus]KAB7514964.1 HAD hydrolase-like protein [Halosegnis rubeus]KAB7518274.1 HAD hydrolase-like protein [Halosegnis rubeus]KAB7519147.1 HAD hydrolase-like protein [Halosegnis rubeus]